MNMSSLDEFLLLAEEKVGTNGSWSWSKNYSNKNTPWSADFISACAKELKLTSILPTTHLAQDMIDKGTSSVRNPGTWLPGTIFGGNSRPKPGDIISFNLSSSTGRSDSVGIVKEYDPKGKKMIVISGDSRKAGENRSVVGMETISLSDNRIQGYFRPDWESVG